MSAAKFSLQRMPTVLGALLALVLTLGFAGAALAQGGPRGAIVGTVRDATGAVVPGAQVEVINAATGITERTVAASGDGGFTINLLPVGRYRVVVSAPGFSRFEAPDVQVNVTQSTSVAVTLQAGRIEETITVTDAATTVQLNNPTTGQAIGGEIVENLPLASRNFLTLLALSPGANTEFVRTDALGRGAVSINVNGQRPTNNNYQLEGINANDINLPVLENVPLPNPNTIAEFRTQTSLYDASQGRNGGGNIQVALRSGTNEFHGDAFVFMRHTKLNANDFFNNADGLPRPRFTQSQWGASVGGPIVRNRTFFFFNYQATRAESGAAAGTNFTTNIPVLPADRSPGNLAAVFFPGGLPPGTAIHPSAVRLLNLPAALCPGFSAGGFCIPSLPGTPGFDATGNLNLARLSASLPGTFEDDQYVITMDHQLTPSHRITGRWFSSDNETVRPFGTASTLPHAMNLPGFNRFLKLGFTSVISPRIVNDFRAGFNRFNFALQPTEPITLTDIGATRPNAADFPAAFRILVTGAFSIGTGVNDDRGGTFNTFVLGDDVSINLGNHQLRFGAEGSHYQLNRYNNFAARGSITFGSTNPGQGGAGIPALSPFQNFLLGRVTGTQGGGGFANFYFRATDYSAYVQDDWRVTPRLTFNIGVRLEALSVAHDKEDKLTNFLGFGDGQPPLTLRRVRDGGITRCTLLDCLTFNWAPRVGFAYDLFGNQRTVVRGGYGIYYQRVSNQSLLQTSGGGGFSASVLGTPLGQTFENPFTQLRPQSDFPLPLARVPRLVSFNQTTGAPIFDSASGASLASFFFYPIRDFRPPYTQQFNLTLQRDLGSNFVAEVGYVGTRGVRLIGTGRPLNASRICTQASPCVIPASLANNATVPAGTPGVTRNGDGSISITQSTAANAEARVPAEFLGIIPGGLLGQANDAQSTYHSLQSSLTHRLSRGLYFQASYTFSKSIDNGSGSTFQDELNGLVHTGDLHDLRANRGLSDFDRTHRLVISYTYDLPLNRLFRAGDSGFAARLLRGWTLSGVYTMQSGTPFLIFDSSAVSLQDVFQINGAYPAVLRPGGGPILTSGSTTQRLNGYINTNAFIVGGLCANNQNQPVACSDPSSTGFSVINAPGSLGRNVFRGPRQSNWDTSIGRVFPLTETIGFELRAEFFNVLNHPAFASPQAGGAFFGNYGLVDVSTGDSSILNTANSPRVIQFALKLNF